MAKVTDTDTITDMSASSSSDGMDTHNTPGTPPLSINTQSSYHQDSQQNNSQSKTRVWKLCNAEMRILGKYFLFETKG